MDVASSERKLVKCRCLGVLFYRVLIPTLFLPLAVWNYDLAVEIGIK